MEFKPLSYINKNISHEEFERLDYLTVAYNFKLCVSSIVFKYFNEQCCNFLNEVFNVATESSVQFPFQKTNNGQYVLSYIGPTFWNQTIHTLKRSNNIKTSERNFKKYLLK